MKYNLTGYNDQHNPLCRFRHRFVFWVGNLYEVISAEVVNFHAGFNQPVEKDGYFWGKYELLVSYRKHSSSGEIRQKRFTRGFLIRVPYYITSAGFPTGKREEGFSSANKYTCEAEYSPQVAPLMLFLFPLFNRLKYVPYKAVLHVCGTIYTSKNIEGIEENTVESCIREACHCLRDRLGEADINATAGCVCADEHSVERCAADTSAAGRVEEESNEIVDLNLIALERGIITEQPAAFGAPQLSKSYSLYYNTLMQHQESMQPVKKGVLPRPGHRE